MDAWVDGWMDEWMDGWLGGWMDGWLGGWMDGWRDGWMSELVDRRVTRLVDGASSDSPCSQSFLNTCETCLSPIPNLFVCELCEDKCWVLLSLSQPRGGDR